jgi:catechol 2,3-dioxygenase-like lactoylglutathione lyase family enzyme
VIPTSGLNHLHLNVADVERSLLFYRRVFGATEAFRVGDRMVFLQLPGTEDVITLHEIDAPASVEHFGLLRDQGVDLDDAIAEIEAAGGRLLERGEHAPGVAYAYVTDPDGFTIEI